MAACISLALVFLLSVAVPGTLAAGGRAPTESLKKACNATSSPALCLRTLTSSSRESGAAAAAPSPRRLAELAFRYLATKAPELVAEARRETAATRNQSMLYCLREFNENIGIYARWLRGVAPERGDAEFAEARRRLEGLLAAPSTSGISCEGGQFGEKPVIGRIVEYEAMMQVTLDLMNAAASSNPALAGPPSDYDDGVLID